MNMLNKEKLKEQGWVEIEGMSSGEELLCIATSLGEVRPHPNGEKMSIIIPSDGDRSIRGTFSNRYGYSSFPLHTDTAFWSKPARYIVMGMLNKSSCSTYVLNINSVLNSLEDRMFKSARNAIYMIDTIEGKKYTSLLFKEDGGYGFKFDHNCMIPVNKDAKYFHKEFLSLLKRQRTKSISWTGNNAVVIDNWNVMHGRGKVMSPEINRELMRIYSE